MELLGRQSLCVFPVVWVCFLQEHQVIAITYAGMGMRQPWASERTLAIKQPIGWDAIEAGFLMFKPVSSCLCSSLASSETASEHSQVLTHFPRGGVDSSI